jgi:hypothetical protein
MFKNFLYVANELEQIVEVLDEQEYEQAYESKKYNVW